MAGSLGEIYRILTVKDGFSDTFDKYIRYSRKVANADMGIAQSMAMVEKRAVGMREELVGTFRAAMGASLVVDVFTKITEESLKTEQALLNLKKVMKDSLDPTKDIGAGELTQILDNTRKMAKMYGQDVTEVLNAMERAGRVLKTQSETLVATNAIIQNSIAGNMSLEKSSEYIMASLNQFGRSVSYAKEIGDTWNHLANNYVVSNEDLAQSFLAVGAAAKESGLSEKQLGAAMTALRSAGIPAKQGATAFNTFLNRMKSDKTREALGSVGISIDDGKGNFKNAMAVLEEYSEVRKKLSPVKAQEVDIQLAGLNQYKRLIPLIENMDLYRKSYADVVANSRDSMLIETNRQMDSLTGDLRKLKAEATTALQTIGDGFAKGTLREWVQGLTNTLHLLNQHKDVLGSILDTIVGITERIAVFSLMKKFLVNPISNSLNNAMIQRSALSTQTKINEIQPKIDEEITKIEALNQKRLEARDKAIQYQREINEEKAKNVASPSNPANQEYKEKLKELKDLEKEKNRIAKEEEKLQNRVNANYDKWAAKSGEIANIGDDPVIRKIKNKYQTRIDRANEDLAKELGRMDSDGRARIEEKYNPKLEANATKQSNIKQMIQDLRQTKATAPSFFDTPEGIALQAQQRQVEMMKEQSVEALKQSEQASLVLPTQQHNTRLQKMELAHNNQMNTITNQIQAQRDSITKAEAKSAEYEEKSTKELEKKRQLLNDLRAEQKKLNDLASTSGLDYTQNKDDQIKRIKEAQKQAIKDNPTGDLQALQAKSRQLESDAAALENRINELKTGVGARRGDRKHYDFTETLGNNKVTIAQAENELLSMQSQKRRTDALADREVNKIASNSAGDEFTQRIDALNRYGKLLDEIKVAEADLNSFVASSAAQTQALRGNADSTRIAAEAEIQRLEAKRAEMESLYEQERKNAIDAYDQKVQASIDKIAKAEQELADLRAEQAKIREAREEEYAQRVNAIDEEIAAKERLLEEEKLAQKDLELAKEEELRALEEKKNRKTDDVNTRIGRLVEDRDTAILERAVQLNEALNSLEGEANALAEAMAREIALQAELNELQASGTADLAALNTARANLAATRTEIAQYGQDIQRARQNITEYRRSIQELNNAHMTATERILATGSGFRNLGKALLEAKSLADAGRVGMEVISLSIKGLGATIGTFLAMIPELLLMMAATEAAMWLINKATDAWNAKTEEAIKKQEQLAQASQDRVMAETNKLEEIQKAADAVAESQHTLDDVITSEKSLGRNTEALEAFKQQSNETMQEALEKGTLLAEQYSVVADEVEGLSKKQVELKKKGEDLNATEKEHLRLAQNKLANLDKQVKGSKDIAQQTKDLLNLYNRLYTSKYKNVILQQINAKQQEIATNLELAESEAIVARARATGRIEKIKANLSTVQEHKRATDKQLQEANPVASGVGWVTAGLHLLAPDIFAKGLTANQTARIQQHKQIKAIDNMTQELQAEMKKLNKANEQIKAIGDLKKQFKPKAYSNQTSGGGSTGSSGGNSGGSSRSTSLSQDKIPTTKDLTLVGKHFVPAAVSMTSVQGSGIGTMDKNSLARLAKIYGVQPSSSFNSTMSTAISLLARDPLTSKYLDLILGYIKRESHGNKNESYGSAYGLYQFLPSTASGLGLKNLKGSSVTEQTKAYIKYFNQLYKQYNGNIEKMWVQLTGHTKDAYKTDMKTANQIKGSGLLKNLTLTKVYTQTVNAVGNSVTSVLMNTLTSFGKQFNFSSLAGHNQSAAALAKKALKQKVNADCSAFMSAYLSYLGLNIDMMNTQDFVNGGNGKLAQYFNPYKRATSASELKNLPAGTIVVSGGKAGAGNKGHVVIALGNGEFIGNTSAWTNSSGKRPINGVQNHGNWAIDKLLQGTEVGYLTPNQGFLKALSKFAGMGLTMTGANMSGITSWTPQQEVFVFQNLTGKIVSLVSPLDKKLGKLLLTYTKDSKGKVKGVTLQAATGTKVTLEGNNIKWNTNLKEGKYYDPSTVFGTIAPGNKLDMMVSDKNNMPVNSIAGNFVNDIISSSALGDKEGLRKYLDNLDKTLDALAHTDDYGNYTAEADKDKEMQALMLAIQALNQTKGTVRGTWGANSEEYKKLLDKLTEYQHQLLKFNSEAIVKKLDEIKKVLEAEQSPLKAEREEVSKSAILATVDNIVKSPVRVDQATIVKAISDVTTLINKNIATANQPYLDRINRAISNPSSRLVPIGTMLEGGYALKPISAEVQQKEQQKAQAKLDESSKSGTASSEELAEIVKGYNDNTAYNKQMLTLLSNMTLEGQAMFARSRLKGEDFNPLPYINLTPEVAKQLSEEIDGNSPNMSSELFAMLNKALTDHTELPKELPQVLKEGSGLNWLNNISGDSLRTKAFSSDIDRMIENVIRNYQPAIDEKEKQLEELQAKEKPTKIDERQINALIKALDELKEARDKEIERINEETKYDKAKAEKATDLQKIKDELHLGTDNKSGETKTPTRKDGATFARMVFDPNSLYNNYLNKYGIDTELETALLEWRDAILANNQSLNGFMQALMEVLNKNIGEDQDKFDLTKSFNSEYNLDIADALGYGDMFAEAYKNYTKNAQKEAKEFADKLKEAAYAGFEAAFDESAESGKFDLKSILKKSLKSTLTTIFKQIGKQLTDNIGDAIAKAFTSSSTQLNSTSNQQALATSATNSFSSIAGNLLSGTAGGILGSIGGLLINKLFGGSEGETQSISWGSDSWSSNGSTDYATTSNVYTPAVTKESTKIINFNNTFNITTQALSAMNMSRSEVEKICQEVITSVNRANAKASGTM